MKKNTFRSPKNRYFADVRLINEAFAGGSNVMSYGADTLDECKRGIANYLQTLFGHLPASDVMIRENKNVYPKFSWQTVERYSIGH